MQCLYPLVEVALYLVRTADLWNLYALPRPNSSLCPECLLVCMLQA